jgi:hypothetical protein
VKLKSFPDIASDFKIPNLGMIFQAQIEVDWGTEITGFVLGYNLKILRMKFESIYRIVYHLSPMISLISIY